MSWRSPMLNEVGRDIQKKPSELAVQRQISIQIE
jgi:hypothetical protein